MSEASVTGVNEQGVLTLRLRNPTRRNALTGDMALALAEAMRAAATDPAVKVVVLGSDGDHFSSGLDLLTALNAGGDITPEGRRALVQSLLVGRLHPMIRAVWDCDKPTLASLRGATVGIGLSLALACDLRLMANDAYLQTSFLSRGLFPDGGIAYQLERLCGLSHAKQLLLFADLKLLGAQALEFGLCVGVVPPEELEKATTVLAQKLATLAPLALRGLKRSWRKPAATLETALEEEVEQVALCVSSEDAAEGLAAFFEKRPPSFKGR
jgi:2-(1,2-epoxy-1,2-dihydrophenyl)acetyl-CoA isomerase